MKKMWFHALLCVGVSYVAGCRLLAQSRHSDLLATDRNDGRSPGAIAEVWTQISGDQISQLLASKDFPSKPTTRTLLNSLAIPRKNIENYGTRIRGYIHPARTGHYIFHISGDNESQFFLSSDDKPTGLSKEPIAFLSDKEWTSDYEWEKFPGQVSKPIRLISGHRYFFEVLHKNGRNDGGVAVGWQQPDGLRNRPIPDTYLSTFDGR
ncbi:MAG TPA: PA14 domain-containing protein [Oligoflexus sp.]|uniref:PA14 domain-containing protein n=1 Tax=Oligoflexus sp. TaxID=1971216 RepID=UPI002D50B2AB|nr:PA14 domain-containing protein [Oligoflexus sp.]HYX33234.1 PA14 domain-containing protein [Oligoflexus sp.]